MIHVVNCAHLVSMSGPMIVSYLRITELCLGLLQPTNVMNSFVGPASSTPSPLVIISK